MFLAGDAVLVAVEPTVVAHRESIQACAPTERRYGATARHAVAGSRETNPMGIHAVEGGAASIGRGIRAKATSTRARARTLTMTMPRISIRRSSL